MRIKILYYQKLILGNLSSDSSALSDELSRKKLLKRRKYQIMKET